MYDIGVNAENFNPIILYTFYKTIDKQFVGRYHCHDFIEFTYIISGNLKCKIENKVYDINDHTLLPFNSGVCHQELFNSSSNSKLEEVHIAFKNIKLNNIPPNHIMIYKSDVPFKFIKFKEEFHDCCLEIVKEQKSNSLGKDIMIKSLVMKAITLFLKEVACTDDTLNYIDSNKKFEFQSDENSNVVPIIINYFEKNYMHNISLNNIAKNMYLSSIYISKLFKEVTGESPINYLINVRLRKAKKLLKKTDMSIKSISQSVGYSDAYYFSKLFKKYIGISPSKFRDKFTVK